MLERETLRYVRNYYRTVLVCVCGRKKEFRTYAPKDKDERQKYDVFALVIASKISASGWLELFHENHDLCPDCRLKRKSDG